MSDYHPEGGHDRKPWRARVKRGKQSHFLGWYETKEVADEVERKFKEDRGWIRRKSPEPHVQLRNGRLIDVGTKGVVSVDREEQFARDLLGRISR